MNTAERRQFLEIVQHFKLASEATREMLAIEYQAIVNRQAKAKQPITPVLGFCMERAGSPERAQAIFEHVLSRRNLVYWGRPEVPPYLLGSTELQSVCYRYAIVPVKATPELVVLCGTNPYEREGFGAVCSALPGGTNAYQVFVLSEPQTILRAIHRFAGPVIAQPAGLEP